MDNGRVYAHTVCMASSRVLGEDFFARSALEVAPDLLGKHLVRRWRGRIAAYRIVETEAYHGYEDRASHASRGRTERNQIMFGPPGHLYVYLVYGRYNMLNVVTGAAGEPSAVLIRGIEGCVGPGRLTEKLHITRARNGFRADPERGVWFEDRGEVLGGRMVRTPRIGVAYAGPEWAGKEYRFVLETERSSPSFQFSACGERVAVE